MARITIGSEIRRHRLSVGKTIQDMAYNTGYSIAFIAGIETDKQRPNIEHLEKIKAYLASHGVPADNMKDFIALASISRGNINLGWFDKDKQKRLLDIVMED